MIVIATCEAWPKPTEGLTVLVDALESKGISVSCIPWQHTDIDLFTSAELVLPLCTWDYTSSPDAFQNWIDQVVAAGGRYLNAADVLKWNMRKTYLLELAKAGLNVTPTRYLPDADPEQLATTMEIEGWGEAVIKPVYGQSGNGVTRVALEQLRQGYCSDGLQGEILIQPYIREIETAGEVVLCFAGDNFSHALRRIPAPGEWRANSQYGVRLEIVKPDKKIIDTARNILRHAPSLPDYARVDGIMTASGFMLTELELIEPALYLHHVPDSADVFADCFIQSIHYK